MALPPPSILFIAALSVVDLLGTVVVAAGLAFFGAALAQSDMGSLLGGWSITVLGFVALKLIALVGMLYARRWAVILGAVAFKIPIPPEWLGSLALSMIFFAGSSVLYLACTLPHWQRMTWKFP